MPTLVKSDARVAAQAGDRAPRDGSARRSPSLFQSGAWRRLAIALLGLGVLWTAILLGLL